MDFVLAQRSYDIRSDQKSYQAKCYPLGSNDKKDVAKVPRDVVKPGAHAGVFCTAL